jgi:cellobiose phosphorylase
MNYIPEISKLIGVRGKPGDLLNEAKLVSEQFEEEGNACLITRFADRKLEVVYHNQRHSAYGDYPVHAVSLDGDPFEFDKLPVMIPRRRISSLDPDRFHRIEIELR